jgi:hypothetical protein
MGWAFLRTLGVSRPFRYSFLLFPATKSQLNGTHQARDPETN